jgi:hypothetical protein
MSKLAIAAVLAIVASPASAQSFDSSLGSGNITTLVSPGAMAPVCEIRRVQFSDASGWRARDILVCCSQGQCTSRLAY